MSTEIKSAAAKSISKLYSSGAHKDLLLPSAQSMLRAMISPLVSQMGITKNTNSPIDVLDNACGTGVFTCEVQETLERNVLEKSSFLCADFSESMVELVKRQIANEGWVNTSAEKIDAVNNDLPADQFSHVGIGLGLHIIPDPDAVLKNCQHILRDGGILGASTFHKDNTFWITDLMSAFKSLPFKVPTSEKPPMQLHNQGDWTDPAWIEGHLKEKGFKEVEVVVRPGKYHINDAQTFVDTFEMMIGWVMNMRWSEETKREHPVAEVKDLVKGYLEQKYGGKGWDLEWLLITATGRVEEKI